MEKQILTTKEASDLLGCSSSALKQSRCDTALFGVAPPKFLKMGYSVRYKRETLIEWLNQFKETEAKK